MFNCSIESSNAVTINNVTEEVITEQDSDNPSSIEEQNSNQIQKTSVEIGQFFRYLK